jgi:integrase
MENQPPPVNFEQGTLHVYQQLRRVPKAGEDGKEFVLQTTKTASSDRVLDLDVDLLADLRTLRKNQLEERLLLGKRWKDTWGLVFVSENGAPIHASNLLAHFRKALKAAGLPTIRFHDLRHTYAALSIAAGVDLYTLSRRMGHNSITVTADKYGHLYQGHTQDVDSLDRLLKRA